MNLRCPPEGGLYTRENRGLPVAVIATVIVTMTMAAAAAAVMLFMLSAPFPLFPALAL